MYAELSAAIQSIASISDLVKASRSLGNLNEINAAVAEVNSKMMEAMAKALASLERQGELQRRVQQLEQELEELRKWRLSANRYALHKFPPGSLAYRLKEEFEAEEPGHFLCAKCFDNGAHTKLQVVSTRRLSCFVCNSMIPFDFDPSPATRLARG